MSVNKQLWLLFALLLLLAPRTWAGALGADVNADVDAFGKPQMDSVSLGDFAGKNTVYALPLFNLPPGDHARYWDSMAEQYQSAQIDFVAVWLKGNDQPATFANLVTALNKRGLTKRVKVMPFDDNPASWTALWNFDHGSGYGYKVPFDLSDSAAQAFVWDHNLKAFFLAVPDANRYKIDGRPVYAIWSGSPAFLANLNGSGSKLLSYLRAQCRSTFGFNPYIMVSEDWVKNDPSSDAPGVVDAVYPWFTPVPGPNYSTWKVHMRNGATYGTCIPSFHISNPSDPNAPTWIVDPQHGKTLTMGLAGTIGNPQCLSTFLEGFDDYWENATLWRARNLDPNGKPVRYAETGYDYPNQRINLVRRYSNNPFPKDLKEEAESCDSFSGAVPNPNQPNFYRNGSIAVEDTTDVYGGYDVCRTQAGETLTWQEVPLEGTVHLTVRAAATAGGRLHLSVDGIAYPAVRIPKTGGGQNWTTVDMGAYTFASRSYHTVSLVWDTPGVSVNWWQVQAGKRTGEELGADLPQQYLDFLRVTDGLNRDGLFIYASASSRVNRNPAVSKKSFAENNLDWRSYERRRNYLMFADSDISWYVLNLLTGQYELQDLPSGSVMETFDTFDALITEALWLCLHEGEEEENQEKEV